MDRARTEPRQDACEREDWHRSYSQAMQVHLETADS